MEHNNYYKNDDVDLMFHMKIINYPVYNHLYNLSKILALFVVVVEVAVVVHISFNKGRLIFPVWSHLVYFPANEKTLPLREKIELSTKKIWFHRQVQNHRSVVSIERNTVHTSLYHFQPYQLMQTTHLLRWAIFSIIDHRTLINTFTGSHDRFRPC